MTLITKIPPIYPKGIYISKTEGGGSEISIHLERLKIFHDHFQNNAGYINLLLCESQKGFEYFQLNKYQENLSGDHWESTNMRVHSHLQGLQHRYEQFTKEYKTKFPYKP